MKQFLLIFAAITFCGCNDEKVVPKPASKWITEILEYNPAPGQFINTPIGSQNSAADIVGKRGMVSLGGYGGYIVFRFEKPIINGDGADFVIHGNAFTGSSEPGAVMVSEDKNGNGIPDDEWYEIAGSHYAKSTKNYEITYSKPANLTAAAPISWADNFGAVGVLDIVPTHTQSYWPNWIKSPKFNGNKVEKKPTIVNNIWVLGELGSGYADNFSDDYMQVINGDDDTRMSNKFDLSASVVKVDKAHFIKVYTCVNEQAGVVGELSTEVCGAIIINY